MKRVIGILLCIVLMVSMTAVAFTSASAEEAESKLFTEFTKDTFVGYGSYEVDKLDEDGKKVTDADGKTVKETVTPEPLSTVYNDDKSFRMESDGYIYGIKEIFKLSEYAKSAEALEYAKKNADEKYAADYAKAEKKAKDEGTEFDPTTVTKPNPFVVSKAYVESAVTEKGLQQDSQVIFSYVFTDGSIHTATIAYLDMYQTATINIPFSYQQWNEEKNVTDTIPLETLEGVESIQAEMYHWNLHNRITLIASPVVYGEPALPKLPPITTKGEVTAELLSWNSQYRQDYSNAPDRLYYSPVGGDDYKKSGDGQIKMFYGNAAESQQQLQAYYKFDRDKMNYGLAVANDPNNSHTAQVTITLESCIDQDGKPVGAEVGIAINTYENGYEDTIRVWQEPGTVKTYTFDTSKLGMNSIAGIKCYIQNYWYYDKDGKVVEFSEKDEKNPGTGVKNIYIKAVAYFSTISVLKGDVKPTNGTVASTAPTTTAASNGVVEGAGYEFFQMTKDIQAVEWGNAPEQVIYNPDKTVTLKSPTQVNKQHQMGWLVASSEDNKTVLTEEQTEATKARIKQALEYAKAPGAPGLLAFDVTVVSAVNGSDTSKPCSVEVFGMIHASNDQSVSKMAYVNVGETKTFYIDVSELDAENVNMWHIAAQNYANTDSKGNACGCTNVEVKFTNPYVAGNAPAAATRVTVPADNSTVEQLYKLYQQLPKTIDGYTTEQAYNMLSEFIDMYILSSDATKALLEEKYNIDMFAYGQLLEIWNELPSFDDVETGSGAMPVCAVAVAAAAAFVIFKSRKSR